MRYQFTRAVVVEGVPHHVGDVVYGSTLPEGSVKGLLRMGHIVPFAAGPVEQSASPPPAEGAEPQAAPKKPAKK